MREGARSQEREGGREREGDQKGRAKEGGGRRARARRRVPGEWGKRERDGGQEKEKDEGDVERITQSEEETKPLAHVNSTARQAIYYQNRNIIHYSKN